MHLVSIGAPAFSSPRKRMNLDPIDHVHEAVLVDVGFVARYRTKAKS
jgi:hypothetical protein